MSRSRKRKREDELKTELNIVNVHEWINYYTNMWDIIQDLQSSAKRPGGTFSKASLWKNIPEIVRYISNDENDDGDPMLCYCAYTADGKYAGFICGDLRLKSREAYVQFIQVSESARRKGVGKALVEHFELLCHKMAQKKNDFVARIYLDALSSAVVFWKSVGYDDRDYIDGMEKWFVNRARYERSEKRRQLE